MTHGEAKLEPLPRPTSSRDAMYHPAQRPQPEHIDTPNTPRPALQVPLPVKKRFQGETSPINTERVKHARQLFPPEERDEEEEELTSYPG